jgi:predicted phage terminase large subunit-like protein
MNGIIIILTRWHENDLAGQLLEKMKKKEGENFRVVSFPMVAEEDEYHELDGKRYLLRKQGEILFPERMPQKFVDACKMRGALVWSALYQQRPSQKGGGVFKSEHLQRYKMLPRLRYRYMHADTAIKDGEINDYTVFSLWGYGNDNKLYLIDMRILKIEAVELEKTFYDLWAKWKKFDPRFPCPIHKVGIEDKASGTQLIQKIKKGGGIPIVGIPRKEGKASRAMAVQGYYEAGLVCVPDMAYNHEHTDGEFMSEFTRQLEAFTLTDSHKHDDAIEGMMDACIEVFANSNNIWDMYRNGS